MKAAFCVLAILSVLGVAAQEQKAKKNTARMIDSPSYLLKAEGFVEMSEADRMVYTSGLMDGFFASGIFGASHKTVAKLESCTKDMDSKQISAIITKYVNEHPESWHLALSVDAFNALSAACGVKFVD